MIFSLQQTIGSVNENQTICTALTFFQSEKSFQNPKVFPCMEIKMFKIRLFKPMSIELIELYGTILVHSETANHFISKFTEVLKFIDTN